MKVYRITRPEYSEDISGEGAKENGGRWNHKGTPVVYTSAHMSLAFVEMLVNADPYQLHGYFKMMVISFEEKVTIRHLQPDEMPEGWRMITDRIPFANIGTPWLVGKKELVMSVPSAVVPLERNYLINPTHPDFHRVKLETAHDFIVDPRFCP